MLLILAVVDIHRLSEKKKQKKPTKTEALN